MGPDELERGRGHDLRHLLRQVMARARNYAALVGTGKEARVTSRGFRRPHPGGLAVPHDRWCCNRRAGGELPLDGLERGVARRIAEAMAVGLNGHIDEIRIVE